MFLINCDLPKDSNKSWESVKQNGLKVGIVYTSKNSKQHDLINSEYKLVKNFAKLHGLKIISIEDSETTLIDKLKNYKLNVVIGGFDKKSLWKKAVGMTAMYDGKHVIFITKGENELLFHLNKFLYANK